MPMDGRRQRGRRSLERDGFTNYTAQTDWEIIQGASPAVLLHPDDFSTDTWTNTGTIGGSFTEVTNPPTKDSSSFANTALTFDGSELLTYAGTASNFDYLVTGDTDFDWFVASRPTDDGTVRYLLSAEHTGSPEGFNMKRHSTTRPLGIIRDAAGTNVCQAFPAGSTAINTGYSFTFRFRASASLTVTSNLVNTATDSTVTGTFASAVASGLRIGARGDGDVTGGHVGQIGLIVGFSSPVEGVVRDACNRLCRDYMIIPFSTS